MSASDCIVSKPGGLTVSEALAKKPAYAAGRPHPGARGAQCGVSGQQRHGRVITRHFPIDEAVYELFRNPVRLDTVRQTMQAVAHPDATERLADFIMRLGQSK